MEKIIDVVLDINWWHRLPERALFIVDEAGDVYGNTKPENVYKTKVVISGMQDRRLVSFEFYNSVSVFRQLVTPYKIKASNE